MYTSTRGQKRAFEGGEDEGEEVQTRLTRLVADHQRRIEQLEKSLLATSVRLPDAKVSAAWATVFPDVPVVNSPPGVSESLSPEGHRGSETRSRALVKQPSQPKDSHQMLDDTFTRLENTLKAEDLSGPEDDDDLLIRYLVNGWDAAAGKHRLDTVWQFLRMFDQYVYEPMKKVERLVALRALRNMLLHKIQPTNQPVREIPPFFAPTALQRRRKHCSLADYFAWPVVRDYFVRNQDELRSAPQSAHTAFARHFRFDWPYDFRDAYTMSKASGRFGLSREFDCHFNRLQCWQLRSHQNVSIIPFHLRPILLMDSPPAASMDWNEARPSSKGDELRQGNKDCSTQASAVATSPNTSSSPLPTLSTSPFSRELEDMFNDPLIGLVGNEDNSHLHSDQQHPADEGVWAGNLFALDNEGNSAHLQSTQPHLERQKITDDWAWAYDTAKPENAAVQALLDMAMPM